MIHLFSNVVDPIIYYDILWAWFFWYTYLPILGIWPSNTTGFYPYTTSTWVFEPLSLSKASAVASSVWNQTLDKEKDGSTSVGPFFEGWRSLNIHFHPFPRNFGVKTSAVPTQKDSLKLDILILTASKLTNRVGSVFRTLPTFQDSGRQQLEYAAQRDLQVGSPAWKLPTYMAPNSPDTRGKIRKIRKKSQAWPISPLAVIQCSNRLEQSCWLNDWRVHVLILTTVLGRRLGWHPKNAAFLIYKGKAMVTWGAPVLRTTQFGRFDTVNKCRSCINLCQLWDGSHLVN